MPEQPDNYVSVQKQWSECKSQGIEDGARQRVSQCCNLVADNGLELEFVNVLGPQHGFELAEFKKHNVTCLSGRDCVPEFVQDCREKGFSCTLGTIESLLVDGAPFANFYASHVLEHCYDLPLAISNIKQACISWTYVALPLEPEGGKDEAHFSRIKDPDLIPDLFKPMVPIWSYNKKSSESPNSDLRWLFVKR